MNLETAFKCVDRYLASDNHQPILVDLADAALFNSFRVYYSVGEHKIQLAESFAATDALPQMDKLLHSVRTTEGNVFLFHLSTFLKLQGVDEVLNGLKMLLDDVQPIGKLVVVTFKCKHILQRFDRRLFDSFRILLVGDANTEDYSNLYFLRPYIPLNLDLLEITYAKSLKLLPAHIEQDGSNDTFVVTEFTAPSSKFFNIKVIDSSFVALRMYHDEFKSFDADYGTEDQWALLLKNLQVEGRGFMEYIRKIFGSELALANALSSLGSYSEFQKWLLFVALKVYGAKQNNYLSIVIAKACNEADFYACLFNYLLEIEVKEDDFGSLYNERKYLLKNMPSDSANLIAYCKKVSTKGLNAVYYLTDNTTLEKEIFIKQLVAFAAENSRNQVEAVLKTIYPALAEYLAPYQYGEKYNEYFDLYKYSKLVNVMQPRLAQLANEQIDIRQFLEEPHRASLMDKIEKANTQLYFMDAMGVEFLSYIQLQCFKRGLDFKAQIGRCNLPSITFYNKEFTERFEPKDTKNIKDLDELKHEDQTDYNYERVKEPIHIVKELAVIDKVLAGIDSDLQQGKLLKVLMVADHGSTRMAVIAERVNQWEMAEKGQHSGRCCPVADVDSKPDCATEDNNHFSLLNYDRFKGGRKGDVEVHGGASLEEVLVPIIEIGKSGQKVICSIEEGSKKIKASFKTVARIQLFISKALDNISIVVNGKSYPAQSVTEYLYNVEMPDIKKKGTYYLNVLAGQTIIAQGLCFEVESEGMVQRRMI